MLVAMCVTASLRYPIIKSQWTTSAPHEAAISGSKLPSSPNSRQVGMDIRLRVLTSSSSQTLSTMPHPRRQNGHHQAKQRISRLLLLWACQLSGLSLTTAISSLLLYWSLNNMGFSSSFLCIIEANRPTAQFAVQLIANLLSLCQILVLCRLINYGIRRHLSCNTMRLDSEGLD